jgi:TPR repeat protein
MAHDTVELACRLADQHRYREAFRLLLRSGRNGDSRVYLNLGFAYDVGQGIRRSKAKALHWYRRALQAGDATAAHNIATVFRDRGDVVRSGRWLRRAVALGESGSNLELGQLLLSHLGQPEEALACFRAIGEDESEADREAAKAWVAVAEGLLAGREGPQNNKMQQTRS